MLYSKIEGEGKPLLILHGFLGMSDNWKTLANQYVSNGFEVHSIDLRNHGRSFHSEVFNYEIMVDDVLKYCQFKNLKNINLIGHSMGGKVAMLFAVLHPDITDKLIVADIGTKFYPQHHQQILAGLNAVDFSKKPSRSDIEGILSAYISDLGTRQFLLKNLYWETPEHLAFRFNLKVLTANIDEVGKALSDGFVYKKPAFFIRGGHSNYILDADFEGIKNHFPAATFDTIPNAGHWLHAENPALFLEQTLRFLNLV